jgi:hypothetical protein
LRGPQVRGNPDGFSDGSGVSGRGTASWIATSRSPGNDAQSEVVCVFGIFVYAKLLTVVQVVNWFVFFAGD